MNIWNILDIAPTQDEKSIKRAYAKLIKTIDQASEAARFQQVREAYDQALVYARHQRQEPAAALQAVDTQIEMQPLSMTEELGDNVAVENFPPKPPASVEPDLVTGDIQTLDHLVVQDQQQASEQLHALLASERYISLQNRERLELGLLYMLYQSEVFPDVFAQAAQTLFNWNLYDNPFKPNTTPSHVYIAIVREIARQRSIRYVIDNYHQHKPPLWQEAEKIIFAPFDQVKFEQVLADPDMRTALIHIFRFIYKQKFHPEEFPVSYETNQWVLEHVKPVKPPAPRARRSRWRSYLSTRFAIMLAVISLFQVLAHINNDNDDYQSTQNPVSNTRALQSNSHKSKFKDTSDLPYRLNQKLLKQLTDPDNPQK